MKRRRLAMRKLEVKNLRNLIKKNNCKNKRSKRM
jgi:hypothetical protein